MSDVHFRVIGSFFNSATFSDISVWAGTVPFHAHLAILTPFTPWFAKAVEGNFKESHERSVSFPEHTAHSVWRALKFCYTGRYPVIACEDLVEDDTGTYQKHFDVYMLADFLGMEELKSWAVKCLSEILDSWMQYDSIADLVDQIYSKTTNKDLKIRQTVVRAAHASIGDRDYTLALEEMFLKYPEFSAAVLVWEFKENLEPRPCKRKRP